MVKIVDFLLPFHMEIAMYTHMQGDNHLICMTISQL